MQYTLAEAKAKNRFRNLLATHQTAYGGRQRPGHKSFGRLWMELFTITVILFLPRMLRIPNGFHRSSFEGSLKIKGMKCTISSQGQEVTMSSHLLLDYQFAFITTKMKRSEDEVIGGRSVRKRKPMRRIALTFFFSFLAYCRERINLFSSHHL